MKTEISFKTLSHNIEVKSESEGKLHIRAYACAFGNVDSYGDIIEPTALDEFLKSEDAARMKLCYQHNFSEVIGVITDKGVDAYGMWFEADIIDTTTGQDVQKLLKAGAINEFSIGYYTHDWHEEKVDDEYYRHLDNISIVEISPVTRAANPKAILLDAKSEEMTSSLREMKKEDFERLHQAVNEEYARRVLALL